jgi:plasmid stabilization system protein ParE
LNVRLTRTALNDIGAAADWYQAKRDGLGDEFLARVDEAIEKIGANPLSYRKVSCENRRCNVERFPYALFFKVENDAIVVACLHASRNPSLVKERAAGVLEMKPKPKP